jgi:hypothetical protein
MHQSGAQGLADSFRIHPRKHQYSSFFSPANDGWEQAVSIKSKIKIHFTSFEQWRLGPTASMTWAGPPFNERNNRRNKERKARQALLDSLACWARGESCIRQTYKETIFELN